MMSPAGGSSIWKILKYGVLSVLVGTVLVLGWLLAGIDGLMLVAIGAAVSPIVRGILSYPDGP